MCFYWNVKSLPELRGLPAPLRSQREIFLRRPSIPPRFGHWRVATIEVSGSCSGALSPLRRFGRYLGRVTRDFAVCRRWPTLSACGTSSRGSTTTARIVRWPSHCDRTLLRKRTHHEYPRHRRYHPSASARLRCSLGSQRRRLTREPVRAVVACPADRAATGVGLAR